MGPQPLAASARTFLCLSLHATAGATNIPHSSNPPAARASASPRPGAWSDAGAAARACPRTAGRVAGGECRCRSVCGRHCLVFEFFTRRGPVQRGARGRKIRLWAAMTEAAPQYCSMQHSLTQWCPSPAIWHGIFLTWKGCPRGTCRCPARLHPSPTPIQVPCPHPGAQRGFTPALPPSTPAPTLRAPTSTTHTRGPASTPPLLPVHTQRAHTHAHTHAHAWLHEGKYETSGLREYGCRKASMKQVAEERGSPPARLPFRHPPGRGLRCGWLAGDLRTEHAYPMGQGKELGTGGEHPQSYHRGA